MWSLGEEDIGEGEWYTNHLAKSLTVVDPGDCAAGFDSDCAVGF